MHKIEILLLALNVLTLVNCDIQPPVLDNFGSKDERLKADKQQKFPPCKSCSMFVESFKKVTKEKRKIKEKLTNLSYLHVEFSRVLKRHYVVSMKAEMLIGKRRI